MGNHLILFSYMWTNMGTLICAVHLRIQYMYMYLTVRNIHRWMIVVFMRPNGVPKAFFCIDLLADHRDINGRLKWLKLGLKMFFEMKRVCMFMQKKWLLNYADFKSNGTQHYKIIKECVHKFTSLGILHEM